MAVFDLFKRFVGTNAPAGDRRNVERVRASLGARVLVVDDSATIRAVLGKMLAQDGYEVLKAADGEAAVETAHTHFPDLIFLDIVLPGISGFAVLRALRRDSRTRTTPIIMMSGNQQATEQFYVQRFGADGFVKKPFGRVDVFHAIRSLVQAGRMPARLEAAPVDAIPEGMTREEWNAIPEVGLPDEAHAAPATAPFAASASDSLKVPAVPIPAGASAGVAPVRVVPHAERSVTVAVPVESMHLSAGTSTQPAREWSVPATSLPMRPSVGGGVQAAASSASPPTIVHVRVPKPFPTSATDAAGRAVQPAPEGDKH
ncbi:MAG: response regulator [Rhodanobacteraceae bacterium]|nr:MAG: response regulator [Rhodanobacteraceae bacterium]